MPKMPTDRREEARANAAAAQGNAAVAQGNAAVAQGNAAVAQGQPNRQAQPRTAQLVFFLSCTAQSNSKRGPNDPPPPPAPGAAGLVC